MRKYEFKYKRRGIFFLSWIPGIALAALAFWSGLFLFDINETAVAIVAVVFLLGPIIPAMFLATANGYGRLHKNHAEIVLGGRKREIEYSRIKKIGRIQSRYGSLGWRIRIVGERNISLGDAPNTKGIEALEQFMKALQERVNMAKR